MEVIAAPTTGEWLTRGTVWLALTLYTGAEILRSRNSGINFRSAGYLNTAGCMMFLAHVACAFSYYHNWSHANAYEDTARQTAQLTGWNWGGGIYFNYGFAAAWLTEATWWWLNEDSYHGRPRWMTVAARGFFLFMILNGAVVFAHGAMRAVGIALCLILVVSWWPRNGSAGFTP
jgi:hypothetical protein